MSLEQHSISTHENFAHLFNSSVNEASRISLEYRHLITVFVARVSILEARSVSVRGGHSG